MFSCWLLEDEKKECGCGCTKKNLEFHEKKKLDTKPATNSFIYYAAF